MVKIMCNERAKSGVNPIFTTVLWFAATYLFSIIWDIAQIIFEFNLSIVKIVVCFGITVFYAWYLITRLLTEFEFCVGDGKLSISKIVSKRTTPLGMIALANIVDVCTEEKLKKYDVKKLKNFTRPGQMGDTVYVVYKSDNALYAIKIKPGKELLNKIREEHKI